MANIQYTLKAISDLDQLVSDGIPLIKSGISIGSIFKLLGLIADLKAIAVDAPHVLPELKEKDLDAEEVGQLGAAGYAFAAHVISLLK